MEFRRKEKSKKTATAGLEPRVSGETTQLCGFKRVDVTLLTSLAIFITTPSLLKPSRLGVVMKIANKVSPTKTE